ncbi:hypothetical protein Syun_016572 [Stephania yunnanensis]|uniref:Transmembrane 9 superfamily member n=1 Tax=Stephania yunnanensis TaxID=152371 RepID=A0AAP0J6A6_9MAGN
MDFPLLCKADQLTEKEESLREVLNGDRLINSLYELKFRVVKIMETLCNKNLTIEEVTKFRHAVHNHFYFKMLYDSLPLWGFIGKVKNFKFSDEPTLRYYLFTHVEFDVLYNEDQVIEIEAHLDPNYAVDITEDAVKTILLAGFLYTGPLLLTFSLLNMMAVYYRATAAIPIGTILVIFLIWLLVAVPLLILGGFFGNAFRLNILSSDATKRVPSEIPPFHESYMFGWLYTVLSFRARAVLCL